MYVLQIEREEKNEQMEEDEDQLANFTILPINSMKTVMIPFNEDVLDKLCKTKLVDLVNANSKRIIHEFSFFTNIKISWYDSKKEEARSWMKIPKPRMGYTEGSLVENRSEWFLESIRTDGVIVELILKLYERKQTTPEDLRTDMLNRAANKKRKYKTQTQR